MMFMNIEVLDNTFSMLSPVFTNDYQGVQLYIDEYEEATHADR